MALSDCVNCWNTPCLCGHEYEGWSAKDLEKFIAVLTKVLHKKNPPKLRRVQLFSSLYGDEYTAKFVDEPGKWEFSKRSASHALGELVRSHPEEFNVEIEYTDDWAKR